MGLIKYVKNAISATTAAKYAAFVLLVKTNKWQDKKMRK